MPQDESFIQRLKEGQSAAYSELIERFEGPLYRFFLCDHGDHHTAQDQTAETFVQLVRSLRAMRGGEDQLRAFVFATARHVQLRRWRRRREQSSALADAAEAADRGPSPLAVAAGREELDRVLRAIGRLEDPLPSVLLLRFVEGLSIEEIAMALEMPLGTVKSHIHRGRLRLKQVFAEKECET